LDIAYSMGGDARNQFRSFERCIDVAITKVVCRTALIIKSISAVFVCEWTPRGDIE
jgi:hypothetical protein